jgi:septum site-determining protein MinC
MRTRQKSVRVFEIISDNFEKVTKFVEAKYVFLKKFLLVIKTNNEDIKKYFNTKELEVRFVRNDFEGSNEKLDLEEKKTPQKNSTKTEIFDKIIRSGVEIRSDNKLVFLNRINSGAKIYSSKEIEVFAEIDGEVICEGEYMIVKKAKKGSIIFNNEVLDEIKTLSFISKNGIKEL